MREKFQNIYKNPWFYLFHSLILLLFLFPYLDPEYSERRQPIFTLIVNSIIMMTIIYTVSPSKRYFFFGLLLAFPAIICFWTETVSNNNLIIIVSTFLLYVYAIWMTVRHLIRTHDFGFDQVFGGSSVYLLLGLTWTTLYQGIELLQPGSFYIDDIQNADNILTWSDFIYYSFTTLTTLGYGDITPIHPLARTLAITESITGVIFIPVIISGIVSLVITYQLHKLNQSRDKYS